MTETIAYDFGANQRHGIFRAIPTKVPYDNEHFRIYPLHDLQLSSPDGEPDAVSRSESAGVTRLRIGDPYKTVSGRHLPQTPGLQPARGTRASDEAVPLIPRDPVAVEFTPPAGRRPGQIGTLLDEQANVVDVTATIVDLAVRGYLRIDELERAHGGSW